MRLAPAAIGCGTRFRLFLAGFGRKQDHFLQAAVQGGGGRLPPAGQTAAFEFVGLGEHRDAGALQLPEPVHQIALLGFGGAPDVHDQHDGAQIGAPAQVAFDHGSPLPSNGGRHARIAVSGQVGESESPVDQEKVEQLGAARGGTGARQAAAVEQAVDQRRLAHVGTSHEGDFRQIIRWTLGNAGRAGHKLGGLDDHRVFR